MSEFLCLSCMTWTHEAPRCTHDSGAPCVRCERPRGYRYTADDGSAAGDGDVCARCFWGRE